MGNTRNGKRGVDTMSPPVSGPQIITLDIETAPLESWHWGIWKEMIGLEQIDIEWSILSFSYKKLGEGKVYYYDTSGHGPSKVRNDRALLDILWNVLDQADIVVTQNGKQFDIKKINSRMLMHNMPPYSPVKIIDTREAAQKHFSFTSNKLAWMSEHLVETKKSEHKLFPGFLLWKECLKDNPKAWAEMKKYNKVDVIATEQLYLKMRPWIEGHPNVACYTNDEVMRCPKCNSTNLHKRGYARTQTGVYHRYQCQRCFGWPRGRQIVNSTAKRKSLLIN